MSDYCDDPHLSDPSTLKVAQMWNGLGISIAINDRAHDPQTELLREFLRQHEDSHLVLVPAGAYGNSAGASIRYFEIRKSHPQTIAQRKWWRRLLACLSH